jgi:Undecaprenyl-phosphate galactose phosphotransferase WbaP
MLKHPRLRMGLLMLCADILGFGVASLILLLGNLWLKLFNIHWAELRYLVVLLTCLFLFASAKLYPGMGINPADEIKLVCVNVAASFLLGFFFLDILILRWYPHFLAYLLIGFLSAIFILLSRWGIRILASQFRIWGEQVVIFARGENIERLTRYFLARRRLGYIPVLAVTDEEGKSHGVNPVPVFKVSQFLGSPKTQLHAVNIQTILIDTSFLGDELKDDVYGKISAMFHHVIFVSDMGWLEGASLSVCDFEGLAGIEARRNLLSPFNSVIKRIIDIVGSLFFVLFFMPITVFLIILIKLDSRGPAFYSQIRLGKDGKRIQIYKFRTMLIDADQALVDYLKADPVAKREWNETQKLRNDPRVTRVGKYLRRFSIDEVPQIYNVLLGDMSLVGPRPIMAEQLALYEKIEFYYTVRPGLTGLWQVSGRNAKTFQERARFDLYYVRNWSIWLDIYILARTIWVVLSRDGAY